MFSYCIKQVTAKELSMTRQFAEVMHSRVDKRSEQQMTVNADVCDMNFVLQS